MRKISEDLVNHLLRGNLKQLLNYVMTDNELRLEVRQKGEAFIYYRMVKVIELRSLNVENKYGNLPSTDLAISDTKRFFREVKKSIDDWIEKYKKRSGFDFQQLIAQRNQSIKDRFFILDMEYAFEQNEIKNEERYKRVTFDLLGIDQKRNTIVLFEIKRGIDNHFQDFYYFIHGNNKAIFRKNLIRDVDNILKDKEKIGLIDDIAFSEEMEKNIPDFVLIIEPMIDSENKEITPILSSQYETIIPKYFLLN